MYKLHLPSLNLAALALILLSLITVTLVICVALLGAKVRVLWAAHQSDLSVVKGLIREANENLYRPAVIEPKAKQQYLYEASLRFPASEYRLHNFRYSYVPADKDFKAQVTLASDASLMAMYAKLGDKVFENIPTYQRCSKTFIVQFAEGVDQPEFTLLTSKPLADGRTAYLYKNTTCDAAYVNTAMDVAGQQRLLEAIESY